MPEVVGSADASLVHLIDTPLFRSVMPSKVFEAAAMRRPIILGVGGEAASWIETAEAGIAIEPENETALLEAIRRLREEPALRERLGANGRTFVEQHHDYELLAARYLEVLSQFSNGHKAH
jgi:glycosyltransferase involved in cell wall biosynthesis